MVSSERSGGGSAESVAEKTEGACVGRSAQTPEAAGWPAVAVSMSACTYQRARSVIPSFGGQRSPSLGDSVLGHGVGALLLLEAAWLWYRRSEMGMGVQERRARATFFGVRKLGQEAVGFSEKRNPGGSICTRASTLTDVAGSRMFRKVAMQPLSLLVFSLIVCQ